MLTKGAGCALAQTVMQGPRTDQYQFTVRMLTLNGPHRIDEEFESLLFDKAPHPKNNGASGSLGSDRKLGGVHADPVGLHVVV